MIVLTALLFGGCKRYLDVTPQGKIIPETEEDFEALLNNMLYAIEEVRTKIFWAATTG